MLSEATSVLLVGDKLIQFGYRRKTAARLRVDFSRRFSVPPAVVVTPCWEGAGREVGHAETIGRVTREGFVLYSSNAAENYFVPWMAIGYARGGRDENVDYLHHGDLLVEFGRTAKPSVSITVPLRAPFVYPPLIQVSPFWENQRSGVGHAETVGRVDPDSFDVLSDNRAANHFVSWVAVGSHQAVRAPREEPGRWFASEFQVRDMLVRTIRAGMTAGGNQAIGFGIPAFAATPTVLVTPFWDGAGRGVGHAETLDLIEPHAVRVAAANGADNYFVSLLAIGPR